MILRRHCGLPRVLNSPVFQFALRAGRIFVKGAEGFGPSTCRLVIGCSVPLSYAPTRGAFKDSRPRMPFAYSVIGGSRIAALPSRGLHS